MKPEYITIVSFSLGAMSTILVTHLNNRASNKRELQRINHERQTHFDKLRFEQLKSDKKEVVDNLKAFNLLLGKLEHSISLTSSVIESDRKMTISDFDTKHQEELSWLIELEAIAIVAFPNVHDEVLVLSGLHSHYWGNQRLLLMQDFEKDRKHFDVLQKEVIRIARESNVEIEKLRIFSKNKASNIASDFKNLTPVNS